MKENCRQGGFGAKWTPDSFPEGVSNITSEPAENTDYCVLIFETILKITEKVFFHAGIFGT